MSRVTDDEVRQIIDVDSTITDLSPFRTVAHLIVEEQMDTSGVSEALLKEIERWLSAHFVAIRDPRVAQESIGPISVKYLAKAGKGLESTPYGQQAMALDPTGGLALIGKPQSSLDVIEW